MSHIGTLIESKLVGGNVQEAFHHLKEWYWAVSDMQVKPCPQMVERQTLEWVDLYAWRDLSGDPLLMNVTPLVEINDDVPSDGKLPEVVGKLTDGQVAGASGMRDKHIKKWLHDVQWEEDLEGQGAQGAGDKWHLFVWLVQATWTHGMIPCQLLWSIVELIPKGGGDYHGIGLLEPIWKCIEHMINHHLDCIELHESLHSCCNNHGMGTAIIKAKLAQQLMYLELKPFYGIFLNL